MITIIIFLITMKGGKIMAKETTFAICAVIGVQQYTRKDNTIGYQITAITEEEDPRVTVFFKDGSEGEPKKGDRYSMVLGFDSRLRAIVRYVRV